MTRRINSGLDLLNFGFVLGEYHSLCSFSATASFCGCWLMPGVASGHFRVGTLGLSWGLRLCVLPDQRLLWHHTRRLLSRNVNFSWSKDAMKTSVPGFSPEALKFFVQLKRHNNRPWFLRNKETYEREIKEPMVSLVLALNTELRTLAPELTTEPKRAIYRIYRDVRFSADKSPYKTHTAARSRRAGSENMPAPDYFHFAPDGITGWKACTCRDRTSPSGITLQPIQRLSKILAHRQIVSLGWIAGRPTGARPQSGAPDHPAADRVRHKQFLVWVKYPLRWLWARTRCTCCFRRSTRYCPSGAFSDAPPPGERDDGLRAPRRTSNVKCSEREAE
jgi:uncharacterized protein (TIGR02453 family)